ncbi:ANK1 [Symbiodinium natans]|uniref:ANK1 protein n=1 Tax=Symbiodinium natans TaxID=878477 RepID=A0A812RBR5_9DINO|nr:ANK1 [Symbiodinium natans]
MSDGGTEEETTDKLEAEANYQSEGSVASEDAANSDATGASADAADEDEFLRRFGAPETEAFPEIQIPEGLATEMRDTWQAFLDKFPSREVCGEAIHDTIMEEAPSLQPLFKTPRSVFGLRFIISVTNLMAECDKPEVLKRHVETLGFQHLDAEVTVPRIDVIRDAILSAMDSELGEQDEALAKVCRSLPSAWPKLRRTSKLYMWRLDDQKLNTLQQSLIEDLNLVFVDLHELCERGDAECVWILLSQGMSVKLRDPEGATLLQKATHSGRTTVLKLIIEKGGNINAKGSYGYTPLHEACYLGNPDVCEVLLTGKANVDALSKNGSTPLLVAAREGHTLICDSLLKHGADADDGGDKGWTPLSVAAGEGHAEVCSTLLKYSANVQGFSFDGRYERSALQEAAEQGHSSVVALLLEQKADVHHTFDEGGQRRVTAYELAERAGHSKVSAMLMSQMMSPP